MLQTGSTTNPLPLWFEPGPELVDVLAGDGRLGMGDGVSATLKDTGKKMFLMCYTFNSSVQCAQTVNITCKLGDLL